MVLLRRRRRGLARLAFVAFLCGWMLPFYEAHPLGLADDSACLTTTAAGASTSAKVEPAVAGEGQPSHCYVCHLMRAMNGAVASDVARLVVPLDPASDLLLADNAMFAAVLAAPSSRGPPGFPSI